MEAKRERKRGLAVAQARWCLTCGTEFMGKSGGRQFCEPCRLAKLTMPPKADIEPTAAEVDRMLTEAVRRETAMPWERT